MKVQTTSEEDKMGLNNETALSVMHNEVRLIQGDLRGLHEARGFHAAQLSDVNASIARQEQRLADIRRGIDLLNTEGGRTSC